jgi:zinc transporter ZupT
MLAFLLGLAIGVMATLSIVELWIKNAVENGVAPISAATVAGALLYAVIQPFVPEFEVRNSSPQFKCTMDQTQLLLWFVRRLSMAKCECAYHLRACR